MPNAGPMFLQAFAPDPRSDQLPLSYVPGVTISVLRLDLIDPLVSGNKWYKLRYYLDDAVATGRPVVTWGGAWSNHILATAVACKRLGIPCTGIIRGEEPAALSSTLQMAKQWGMELLFIPRSEYAKKIPPRTFLPHRYLIIPEGGYGETGMLGAASIHHAIDTQRFRTIFCAVGTGTMMAGLIHGSAPSQKIIGIPVLKNDNAAAEIAGLLNQHVPGSDIRQNWELVSGFEFGGYARHNNKLTGFMNMFYEQTGIALDFVYTGKLFFAVTELLRSGRIIPDGEVLVVHSGGLQGNGGLPPGTLVY